MGKGEVTFRRSPRHELGADAQPLSQPAATPDAPISELLERLASTKADSAWSEFLAQYSALIMHVARRHERDPVPATDCFLHVCAALSDDGFRRLLSFRPDGPARFRTWLTAVVANLCIDWTRKQQGRFRPIRAIARLPELEQLVYRSIYVRGMRRAECTRALEPRFPGLTEQTVSEINARLFGVLTPQQRWQANLYPASASPVTDGSSPDETDPYWQLEEPGPGPDELTEQDQARDRLQAALARLPAPQRLLLRLRYEQDLTLAEVARLTREPDPFRAKRLIQAALAALAGLMDASS